MFAKRWIAATALVTGATGFLGGWLVRSLQARGANVVAVVRSHRPASQFFSENLSENVQIEWGNVHDHTFMTDVIARTAPDYFFHTAALADVNQALADPLECFRSSVESTWVALEAVRQLSQPCVTVISSSDKAYGAQAVPYREDAPLTPRHPYEVCKATLDLAAQSYGKIYNLPIGVTRCGNYFGAYDLNFTRLVPGVIRSVLRGERPQLRSNGRFSRDYLHVQDGAEAHILLAERLSEDPSLYGEAFNFSIGQALEVIDVVRRIIAISGATVEPIITDSARAEIPRMELSSEKARRLLGWAPGAPFDERLRQTVDWYRSHEVVEV